MISYTHSVQHLFLPPDPISTLSHPARSSQRMSCINYNSKLKSSVFLLGSSMGGSEKESEIRKFIVQCPSQRVHCKRAVFFQQRFCWAGSGTVPGLASSILGVVKVPQIAIPEVPHTLSCLSYTTFRKQDFLNVV